MPKFGKVSLERLFTANPELQAIFQEVIQEMDIAILEGHRPREMQETAFAKGASKLPWPKSKHNALPSKAVDAAPWYPQAPHIRWPSPQTMRNPDAQYYARFAYMAGLAVGIARGRGVNLRWGGDWDGDGEVSDNSFNDLPHLEIQDA